MARLGQLAGADDARRRNSADTKAAGPLLSVAAARLAAKDWSAAIAGYIGLLASYPLSDQASDALKGIAAASAGMQKSADAQVQGNSAAILAARKDLADAQASSADARAAADLDASKLRADIEALKKQLADAQAKTATAASAANPAVDTAAIAARDGQIADLRAEVQRLNDASAKNAVELEKARPTAAKYDALVSSYSKYLETEAAALKKGGQGASLAAQSSLYDFLGGGGVTETFPGLKDKVAAFQGASQSEALDAFPSDASEIVQQAMAFKDKTALQSYYSSKKDAYGKSGNKLMVNFLDAVSKVIQ